MVQTFKDNPHLKQAVVIGILKVAQESIFSDFNNPRVSTLLDPEIEDTFGFTESEVETLAAYFGLEDEMDGIKEWYNGYLFGGDTVIYNPWSIISFLSRPRAGLKPHWIGTSDNRLIKDVIQLDRREAKITIEKLLRKEEVRKPPVDQYSLPTGGKRSGRSMEFPSPQRLPESFRKAAGTHSHNLAARHSQSGGGNRLGACRTYASRLDFCPSLKKQASCLLLQSRLRSLSPPSMAAFLRYRLSALFGRRVYDSPSRSKPPACFWRVAFVRFRRPPWRLFFAIA